VTSLLVRSKKLEDGKLTVTLGYADDTELTFDWKMVCSITSETSLKMQLDDGRELTAKLRPLTEPGQLLYTSPVSHGLLGASRLSVSTGFGLHF
jgi:hypothetical protein